MYMAKKMTATQLLYGISMELIVVASFGWKYLRISILELKYAHNFRL